MNLPKEYYNPLPDATQTLLLQACLSEGPKAIESWKQWMIANKLDTETATAPAGILPQIYDKIDFSSQRVLSLLYKNIFSTRHGDLVESLKGYYRYVWVRNQMLKDQLLTIVKAFGDEGVSYIVIKGFPAIEKYYQDAGSRSVLDLDIIVSPEHWNTARGVLKKLGWTGDEQYYKAEAIQETLIHGIHYSKSVFELDLHIRFFDVPLSTQGSKSFWTHASVSPSGYKILLPEHSLLTTFIHGYTVDGDSRLRTVADAVKIISSTPSINWDFFISETRRNIFEIPVKIFLEYIHNNGFVPIPQKVRDAFNSASTHTLQAAYFKGEAAADRKGFKGFAQRLILLRMIDPFLAGRARRLLTTYKFQWGVNSLAALAYRAIVKVAGKLVASSRKSGPDFRR